jgi:murein DD-endopeptidase MepM/ murein hydrolase activator NlpD
MSHHKLLLPTAEHRKKHHAFWLAGGIMTAIIALTIWAFSGNSEPTPNSSQKPLNNDTLAIQEWNEYAELTRQTMDIDSVPQTPEPQEATHEDPFLIKGKIKRNQTLFVALKNHGLEVSDIHLVIDAMQKVVDFKKTKPGDKYEVHLDVDRRILKFVYEISPEDISIAQRDGNAYVAQKVDVHKNVERKHLKGVLNSSLYQAFIDLGESGELAAHFMQLFKYDLDFGTDSQRGDKFSLLVEKITLNGKFYRYGRVWAATYESVGRQKSLEAYYYDTPDPDFAGYYDAAGRALKRTFLKTPIVGCTMTSPFNLKRMHPILKRIRPHYGIDWACPTGTPIMSFADGVVTFAGWKGGNGNLLVIEHAHGYTSLYAHLHNFARGIKKGTRVRQGQTVAALGNTGISTGPHLHFSVKKNGKYIDPAAIDTKYAITLSGTRLNAFQNSRNELKMAMTDHDTGTKSAQLTHQNTTPSL